MPAFEELLNYRRSVAELYERLRRSGLSQVERCQGFRRERDLLFANHPQSPLSPEDRAEFTGLRYYPYDPAWRFLLPVDVDIQPTTIEMDLQDDGLVRMQRFGQIRFEVEGQPVSLSLYWILGYGGGVFLPFRDLNNQQTTYGGGRYLLDTIKHADLGQVDSWLVIDFNYAYNPSCAYDPRWHCPLAPQENWLPVAIPAGEQRYPDKNRSGA
jgi:uncharacterized protein (DUF1684 family)